jgi:hypothetical protein
VRSVEQGWGRPRHAELAVSRPASPSRKWYESSPARPDRVRLELPALGIRDITTLVASYREAARQLWNCHYVPSLKRRERWEDRWDVRDSFDRVAIAMFSSLVLEDLGMADVASLAPVSAGNPVAQPGILVSPSSATGAPIMINRDRPRSGYWDHPRDRLAPNDAELHLARFFDFDDIGLRDFRYLEVYIASATDSDLVGRWALLDFEYARIVACMPESDR